MSAPSSRVEGSRETVAPLLNPEEFRNDRKPCARCGVVRRQKPGRPSGLCKDCNYVLSAAEREAWRE